MFNWLLKDSITLINPLNFKELFIVDSLCYVDSFFLAYWKYKEWFK